MSRICVRPTYRDGKLWWCTCCDQGGHLIDDCHKLKSLSDDMYRRELFRFAWRHRFGLVPLATREVFEFEAMARNFGVSPNQRPLNDEQAAEYARTQGWLRHQFPDQTSEHKRADKKRQFIETQRQKTASSQLNGPLATINQGRHGHYASSPAAAALRNLQSRYPQPAAVQPTPAYSPNLVLTDSQFRGLFNIEPQNSTPHVNAPPQPSYMEVCYPPSSSTQDRFLPPTGSTQGSLPPPPTGITQRRLPRSLTEGSTRGSVLPAPEIVERSVPVTSKRYLLHNLRDIPVEYGEGDNPNPNDSASMIEKIQQWDPNARRPPVQPSWLPPKSFGRALAPGVTQPRNTRPPGQFAGYRNQPTVESDVSDPRAPLAVARAAQSDFGARAGRSSDVSRAASAVNSFSIGQRAIEGPPGLEHRPRATSEYRDPLPAVPSVVSEAPNALDARDAPSEIVAQADRSSDFVSRAASAIDAIRIGRPAVRSHSRYSSRPAALPQPQWHRSDLASVASSEASFSRSTVFTRSYHTPSRNLDYAPSLISTYAPRLALPMRPSSHPAPPASASTQS